MKEKVTMGTSGQDTEVKMLTRIHIFHLKWRVRLDCSRDVSSIQPPSPSSAPRRSSRTRSTDRDSVHGRAPDVACGRRPLTEQEGSCLGEDLCGGTSVDPLRALPSMMPPSSNALVLSPGVSLLQAGVGMPGIGVGGVVGLGSMMGLGGPGITSPVNIDLPEHSTISAEEVAAGVQMGIKVRGLDLMRYGRLEDGVYKCSECERIKIPKTFKTSYSFQRHAYLYHEGRPKRFPCPVCGKEFSRPDKRKSHLKEKHGLFQSDPSEQPDFPAPL
ncbi:hypothetical protein SK128_012339 [Halocaridina rubra]|uniref:C2H2-type domain-containing protein n=1 Tax=Halocaridina rubra TaxID=373956 RepID=A0AAN8WRE7_HALRR